MIDQVETTEVTAKLVWMEPSVSVVEARDAENTLVGPGGDGASEAFPK
jgi:hypothetical protein